VTEEQTEALADVKATFREHEVDHEELEDGAVWVIVRQVALGGGWNRDAVDLAVKLAVTYPAPPPYPFYCESGLARTDGKSFSPTQSNNVDIGDGIARTQISLRIPTQESFDNDHETLGARFVAVIAWLRSPR
jgi:Prokaryotic E2 family E